MDRIAATLLGVQGNVLRISRGLNTRSHGSCTAFIGSVSTVPLISSASHYPGVSSISPPQAFTEMLALRDPPALTSFRVRRVPPSTRTAIPFWPVLFYLSSLLLLQKSIRLFCKTRNNGLPNWNPLYVWEVIPVLWNPLCQIACLAYIPGFSIVYSDQAIQSWFWRGITLRMSSRPE